jgi:hypothetical protein
MLVQSAEILRAVVEFSDRRSDNVESDAYHQTRTGYLDLTTEDFRSEITGLISFGHLTRTRRRSTSDGDIVEEGSLVSTAQGRAFVENMRARRLDEALSGLAYGFIMLGEVIRRINILLRGHEKKAESHLQPQVATTPDRGSVYVDQPFYSTRGDAFVARVEGYVRPPDMPVEVPQPSLTEYRAYFEWALSLARKLSDVMSSKESPYTTDVRSSDIVGDPHYRLSPLPERIRNRIDQAVAHHTYWIRDGGWGISEIEVWRKMTLDQFTNDLRVRQPELARIFDEHLTRFRDEVTEYG